MRFPPITGPPALTPIPLSTGRDRRADMSVLRVKPDRIVRGSPHSAGPDRGRETGRPRRPPGLEPTCPPRTAYHSRMHHMSCPAAPVARRIGLVLCLLVSLAPLRISAQERVDTAEFAGRRARLLAGIPDGIAVILGGEEHSYPVRFRQSPDLYYLTGLEEPGVILVLNGVTKKAAVFALKRPKFGAPNPIPDLRDIDQPVQRYGLPIQPMENFFTFLSYAAWNSSVQKLYVQLSPPDDLLHSRGEARAANAIAMEHPVLGHTPFPTQAIERIHAAVPHLALMDVSPKLDEL